ncbi:MAG TPA: tryptophan synthase subunit alpha [Pseudohongiella sp.]|nr:tryptophan synthase subunit alpha [Pseudohongiella sp.]
MSRLTACFKAIRQAGRKAVIPYIVAGDPDRDTTVALMHQLVADGADAIELGMPFSDPSSDGPVVQLGAERALRQGTNLETVFSIVSEFRQNNSTTPIVLMGYLNPLEIMGYEQFVNHAADAGVDGLLIVDMPVSEAERMLELTRARELDIIFLVAPTTIESRLQSICEHSSGYIYYVSLKGVTGASISDADEVARRVASLRERTSLPVVVGFGIKDTESARAMAAISDGVIIGSALVSRIGKLTESGKRDAAAVAEATQLIKDIRQALDA